MLVPDMEYHWLLTEIRRPTKKVNIAPVSQQACGFHADKYSVDMCLTLAMELFLSSLANGYLVFLKLDFQVLLTWD